MSDVGDKEKLGIFPTLPFAPEQFLETKPCAIGIALRAARLGANLSVEAITDRTRIRAVYIDALEAGRLDQFTAPIYAVGFASSYARALGLDPEWAAQAMRDYISNAPKLWRRSGWLH